MNPTYIPTVNTGSSTPQFGQQDATGSTAIRDYQNKLNTQNYGKAGYVPLVTDGKFGPLTQAASKFQSSPIISTGNIHREAKTNSIALDNALRSFNLGGSSTSKTQTTPNFGTTINETANDPYVKMLDSLSNRSNDSTKMLIANIQAQKAREANKINEQYSNYEKGLQLLGIQTNKAQATGDLLAGQIKQAENQHMEKISALDAEESKALMDAENARADNDFKVLKEKMDYVKQLKKDKADALKELHNSLSDNSKSAAIEAHEIYDTLNTLSDTDKESFLIALSQKFNLPLGSLTQALVDEKAKRDKVASKGSKTRSEGKVSLSSASSELKSHLKPISKGGILGDDGYMAPEKFIELRDTWITNKLPKATFDTLYKRYLNPASYSKAGYTTQKSTTSSRKS